MLVTHAQIDVVGLGDRNAEAHRRAVRRRRVLRHGDRPRIGVSLIELDRPRYPVDRVVRLRKRERNYAIDRARVDRRDQRVAGAEDVRLRDRRVEDELFRARVADAGEQRAGVLLDDGDVDVDLVGRAGDGRRLHVDVGLEIAEPLDPHLRALDPRAVVPRALELAHLAPDDFVARARVARDVDLADVDAPARIDEDGERNLQLLAIDVRHRVDVRERVALGAQAVADRLGGRLQPLAREHVAGPHLDEPRELEPRAPADRRRASRPTPCSAALPLC